MSMEEIGEGIKNLLGKLGHPIIGPFITTWAVCNWKVFYTLLGGFHDPQATIQVIETKYFVFGDNWAELLVIPALATWAYLYLGPLAVHWYKRIILRMDFEASRKEIKLRGEEPIAKNEFDALGTEKRQTDENNTVLSMELGVIARMIAAKTIDEININALEIPGQDKTVSLHELVTSYVLSLKENQKNYDEKTLLKGQLLKCQSALKALGEVQHKS